MRARTGLSVKPGERSDIRLDFKFCLFSPFSRDPAAHSLLTDLVCRSAPLSPYSEGGAVGVRQRHMSAGHVPVTSSHTIHYRPDTFDTITAPQYSPYTVLGPPANGDISHHSSYRNTPNPQVGSHPSLTGTFIIFLSPNFTSSPQSSYNTNKSNEAVQLRNFNTKCEMFRPILTRRISRG